MPGIFDRFLSRRRLAGLGAAFIAHWKAETGETFVIQQSRGGSSKPARAVFGNWIRAEQTHFADGGVFDQIHTKK